MASGVLARVAAVSAPAPTMAKLRQRWRNLGNATQPSAARCVVRASGAAAGWRRGKSVPGSAGRDPTFHTLVHSEPGTITPADRARPGGDAWSYGRPSEQPDGDVDQDRQGQRQKQGRHEAA